MVAKNGTTEVIELTPRGRGALAVVLVAGPEAVGAVDACFHAASGRSLAQEPIDRIVLGRWGGPDGEELIVCRRAAERVEVHCHGGVAAVGAVVEQLAERGCQRTTWQDWELRTDAVPLRAAARVALAAAPTQRTAAILLDQYQGALAAAVRTVLDAALADKWQEAASVLDELLRYRELGRHLTEPWRVVLAGRPNVGKSSLINALAGHTRAIVCDQPGTTRDVVTTTTAIDGWPIQLSDTAGLRDARDELEAAGVARAGAALGEADLVILIFDATEADDVAAPRYVFEARLPATARVLRVLNKVDLLSMQPTAAGHDVLTSAVTGRGIDALVSAIGRTLVPEAPAAGAAVPSTADQVAALEAARDAVARRDAAACATLESLLRTD